MPQVINLPELGEGIKEGTIISILAKVGSQVGPDDTVVEIETDKAVLGVPLNMAGTIVEWYIKEGESVKIGQKLCSLGGEKSDQFESQSMSKESADQPVSKKTDTEPAPAAPSPSTGADLEVNFIGLSESESATVISVAVKPGDQVSAGDTLVEIETDKAVIPFPSPEGGVVKDIIVKEGQEIKAGDKCLVLSGTSGGETSGADAPSANEEQPSPESPPLTPATTLGPNEISSQSSEPSKPKLTEFDKMDFSSVHAGPSTRKLARELGVDLNQVSGSGRNGRIVVEDVKVFAKMFISGSGVSSAAGKQLPDFSKWGNVCREKTSKLRDTIAQAISYSWQAIPHVHQNDNINIDAIMELQKRWKKDFEDKGSILSVTPFIIKAMAECLREYPQFNSSYDPVQKEIIFKEYFNIGVAVDTPQGLIVPVIKDVDKLTIFEIGERLKNIAAQTRERTVKPEDLRGACMTLSNLGGIGGSHFTPIINWPETAILGVGRGTIQPVYDKVNSVFNSGMILPACLAYDHRVIDGADGARFMVRLKNYIENPDLLLMGMK